MVEPPSWSPGQELICKMAINFYLFELGSDISLINGHSGHAKLNKKLTIFSSVRTRAGYLARATRVKNTIDF